MADLRRRLFQFGTFISLMLYIPIGVLWWPGGKNQGQSRKRIGVEDFPWPVTNPYRNWLDREFQFIEDGLMKLAIGIILTCLLVGLSTAAIARAWRQEDTTDAVVHTVGYQISVLFCFSLLREKFGPDKTVARDRRVMQSDESEARSR
jgi:hypothetical protein